MTLVTDALLPLALGRRWLRGADGTLRKRDMAIVAFAGILPDVLAPHIHLEGRYQAFSHTVWACAIFAGLLLAANLARPKQLPRPLAALCLGAYLLHLLCDMISGGIAPFHPFSATRHGGHVVNYLVWYLCDVLLFLHAWLTWRILPGLRKRRLETAAARLRANG